LQEFQVNASENKPFDASPAFRPGYLLRVYPEQRMPKDKKRKEGDLGE